MQSSHPHSPAHATAVPCERVFSSSKETCTLRRSQLGPTTSAKCNVTCRDLRIFDLPVPCRCLAISLVSLDKASKARFLLQVFCKPLKFVIFCKAELVLDTVWDSVPLLLPALHRSCCCCWCHITAAARIVPLMLLLLPTSCRYC